MCIYIYIKFNVAYKILGLYLFDAPIVVSCKEETFFVRKKRKMNVSFIGSLKSNTAGRTDLIMRRIVNLRIHTVRGTIEEKKTK